MAANRKDPFFKELKIRIHVDEWEEIKKEHVAYSHLLHLGLMTLKGSVQVAERFEIQERTNRELQKKISDIYLRLQKIESKQRGGV